MQEKTGTLWVNNKKQIFYRHWEQPQATCVICLLHSIGNHSGSFSFLAEQLQKQGYAVMALDFFGHGNSYGRKGHLPSIETGLEEIELLIAEAKNQYKQVPIILYGQGTGANLALNYHFSKRPAVQGLIASSPWFRLNNPPLSLFINVGKFLQIALPFYKLKTRFSPEKYTNDELLLANYKNDSGISNLVSLRFYMLFYFNGKKLAGQSYRISKPLLLMHGTEDKVNSHKASVDFSRNTGIFTTFKSWPAGMHELHNDVCRNEVIEFVTQWINKEILKK